MAFQPRFCPRPDCPSHARGEVGGRREPAPRVPFLYRRRGHFRRGCDRRIVPRFLCLTCQRGFSEQSFRVDYRLRRPELLPLLFLDRVSKVTHRQSARNHGCSRTTEERHFRRLAQHCERFHVERIADIQSLGGLGEDFSLDELHTFEHARIRKPLTVPLVTERISHFIVAAEVGTLAALHSKGKSGRRKGDPPRRSQSKQKVMATLKVLFDFAPKDRVISLWTDKKSTYPSLVKEVFGERCTHLTISSRAPRDGTNPLWTSNHLNASARDGISRLVRRSWAMAKKLRWLHGHLAIWVCYRNFIRARINAKPLETPAMKLGLEKHPWCVRELLEWRVFPPVVAQR